LSASEPIERGGSSEVKQDFVLAGLGPAAARP